MNKKNLQEKRQFLNISLLVFDKKKYFFDIFFAQIFGLAFCVRNCMKYKKIERIYSPLLISSCDDGAEMEM